VFSNIDEDVQRRIRRPAKEARPTNLERALAGVSLDGRHLGPRKAGRIDVDRLEKAQATGIRALAFRPVAGKGVRRLDLAGLSFAEKAAALSPRKCSGTARGGQSTRSRQRAVKHGAVGG
jgi:hypothetical protein